MRPSHGSGTGVLVAVGTGVSVGGGFGVFVGGGTGVFVAGRRVDVGGSVAVGTGVCVGVGDEVSVAVGVGDEVDVPVGVAASAIILAIVACTAVAISSSDKPSPPAARVCSNAANTVATMLVASGPGAASASPEPIPSPTIDQNPRGIARKTASVSATLTPRLNLGEFLRSSMDWFMRWRKRLNRLRSFRQRMANGDNPNASGTAATRNARLNAATEG